jgi:hypothetical protein
MREGTVERTKPSEGAGMLPWNRLDFLRVGRRKRVGLWHSHSVTLNGMYSRRFHVIPSRHDVAHDPPSLRAIHLVPYGTLSILFGPGPFPVPAKPWHQLVAVAKMARAPAIPSIGPKSSRQALSFHSTVHPVVSTIAHRTLGTHPPRMHAQSDRSGLRSQLSAVAPTHTDAFPVRRSLHLRSHVALAGSEPN